jgi:hypothetical protein
MFHQQHPNVIIPERKPNVFEVVHTNFFVPGKKLGAEDKKPRKGWTKVCILARFLMFIE